MANANVRATSIGTNPGSSILVSKPEVDTGDVLVAFQFSRGELSSMAATGWTFTGASLDDGFLRTKIWTRTPGAEGSYTFGQGLNGGTVIIASVQDWDASKTIRIATLDDAGGGITPSVTPAAAEHLELRAIATIPEVPTTYGAPAGYVLRRQTTGGPPVTAALASRQLSSSSPSGPKSFAVTGGGIISQGVTVSIAAGSVVPDLPPIPPDAPGQGDAAFNYRFSRLFGGTLGDLDLKGVSFGIRVNRRGQLNPETFSASYDIANEDEGDLVAALVPRDPADLTRGAGVVVCDIWGAGTHWGRYWMIGNKISKSRRQRPVLTLNGVTMDALFQYMQLEETIPFVGEDRVEIARQMIAHMQDQPHGDIGLILAAGSSGSVLTKTFEAFQGSYGQHVAATTEGINGFEHAIRTQLGAEGVELHWEWGDPLGDQDAPHEFTDSPHGGNILDWSIEQTPLNYGTRFRARGDSISTDASTSAVPLLSDPYESPHLATNLWPRIDKTVDRPGVTSKAELDAVAEQLASNSGGAPRIFSITILLGQEPTFTPNHVGDSARVTLTNEFFKRVNGGAGLDTRVRTLGMRVTPVGRENGRAEAEIFIGEPVIE